MKPKHFIKLVGGGELDKPLPKPLIRLLQLSMRIVSCLWARYFPPMLFSGEAGPQSLTSVPARLPPADLHYLQPDQNILTLKAERSAKEN